MSSRIFLPRKFFTFPESLLLSPKGFRFPLLITCKVLPRKTSGLSSAGSNRSEMFFKGRFKRQDVFHLFNEQVFAYISYSQSYMFNQRTCGRNCPLMDHFEIFGSSDKNSNSLWKVTSGIFIDQQEKKTYDNWVLKGDENEIISEEL